MNGMLDVHPAVRTGIRGKNSIFGKARQLKCVRFQSKILMDINKKITGGLPEKSDGTFTAPQEPSPERQP